MNKVAMLALANIRKNKGQAVSLLVMMLVAALMLDLGLVQLIGFGQAFDSRSDELNSPHAVFIQSASITNDAQMAYLRSYPDVQQTEQLAVIAGNGDLFLNGSKAASIVIFADATADQKMNPPTLIGQSSALSGNAVYLPYMMQVAGGYELGDQCQINLGGNELHFTVAGFTEEVPFGSLMITVYRFYVNTATYQRLDDQYPEHQAFILQARLGDSSKATELQLDYTREFPVADATGDIGAEGPMLPALSFSTNIASIWQARSLIPTIFSLMIVAFAGVLAVVSLIVIRFRIVNHIEEDMTNIGALKAIGFTSRQVISSIILQFTAVAAAGAALGICAAQLVLPVVARLLESQSAMAWQPGFDVLLAICSGSSLVLMVALAASLAALRVRGLHPIVAMRYGLEAHSFKRNHVQLEKTPGPLQLQLAAKQLLQGKRQAVAIVLIIAIVSFAAVAGITSYYNIGVKTDAFINVITGEKPDAGLLLRDSADTPGVLARLRSDPDVRKAFEYQNVPLLYGDYNVTAFVARDFALLEGSMLYAGRYPEHPNELAVGGLLAEATGTSIGDRITIKQGHVERDFLVTGVIQLMENGGINIVMTYDGLTTLMDGFEFNQLYIYLDEGADVGEFIASVLKREGDVFTNTVDMQELIDSRFTQLGGIFAAIAFGILLVTMLVIGLILYMVIKAMVLRRRHEFGIYKAMGFTTWQLMTQVALSFTPVVLIGVAIGSLGGYLGFNPMFAMLTHSAGVMQTNLPSPVGWTLATGLGLSLFSYMVSMLIAWRIRKVTPYALVSE